MSRAWYYAKNNERLGPVPLAELRSLIAKGGLQPSDLVWSEHLPGWVPARKVRELFPSQPADSVPGVRVPRSRTTPAKPPAPARPLATSPAPSPSRQAAARRHEAVRGPEAPPGRTIVITHPPIRRWSPGLAVVLSFFVPGLGQFYKGQILNGIAWFFFVLVGYAALIVPGLLLHLFCIIGAASGNPWTEGKTTVVREQGVQ